MEVYDITPVRQSIPIGEMQDNIPELSPESDIENNQMVGIRKLPFLEEIRSVAPSFSENYNVLDLQNRIIPQQESVVIQILPNTMLSTTPIDCEICLQHTEQNLNLSCQHSFCQPCLHEYVSINIKEKRVSPRIMICPNVKCKRTLLHHEVEKICPELINEYKTALTEVNKKLLICPNQNCRDYIELTSLRQRAAECPTCHIKYCLRCERIQNITCKLGLCYNSSTGEVKSWGFGKPLKRCPECQYFIEKNGGCNHMTCSRCGYQFRWCCMRPYASRHNEFICSLLTIVHSTNAWFGPHAVIRLVTKTGVIVLGLTTVITLGCLAIGVGAVVIPLLALRDGAKFLYKLIKNKIRSVLRNESA